MRKCITFFGTTMAGTGTAVSVGTAGTAIGASILAAAGWTIGGLTVGSLATAAAVGTATIAGPLMCCIGVCGAIHTESNGEAARMTALGAASGLGAGLVCLPATVTAGAAMTNITGTGLGYAAASGAIGLGVLGTGAVVTTIAIICAGGSFYALKAATNKLTRNRFGFASEEGMASSRSYNEPSDAHTLCAVRVEVVNGKITAIYDNEQHTICDKEGNPVTAEAFANLVLPPNMQFQASQPQQMH